MIPNDGVGLARMEFVITEYIKAHPMALIHFEKVKDKINQKLQQERKIKRLNAARFQLDVMKVPGIIVARTDAEAANLLVGRGGERGQPVILGATNVNLPSYKAAYLARALVRAGAPVCMW